MVDLCKMELDRVGVIKKLDVPENIKRRFLDIGLVPSNQITRLLEDSSHSISAYLIMNSLIAIRNKDTYGIEVEYE